MAITSNSANIHDDDGIARDPATLSFIERILWFERQKPVEQDVAADNDNLTVDADHGADCFNSWAMPDFMRK